MEANKPTVVIQEQKKQNASPFFIQKKYLIPLIIAGLIYCFIVILVFTCSAKIYCLPLDKITTFITSKIVKPSPKPTPRKIRPLPAGKKVFYFSRGSGVVGPKLQQVIVDPLTPERNSTQTVTATIKHDSPVTSAAVKLHTDNMTVDFPLTLASGSATNGTWTGTWQMTDTYNYTYYLQFFLQSATGEYDHGLRFRP